MKRFFITGTDTDCGKTYITKQLVHKIPNALAIKPIATGCDVINGQLINNDVLQLQESSILSAEEINPWRFQRPVSPHIASEEEGISLSIDTIASYCMNFKKIGYHTLFIEGAGGLMVPLNSTQTWIDFLKLSNIPVILVVGIQLGCINHALLTENVLKMNAIHCAGWIANCIQCNMLALQKNIDTLKNMLEIPLLGIAPYQGSLVFEEKML